MSSVIFITYVLLFGVGWLSFLVGPAFLAGFGVIILATIINMVVSRKTAAYQKNLSNATDSRMK
jgi:hypothetical protein